MKKVRVILPQEDWIVVHFVQEEFDGYGEINIGLRNLEHKEVFAWHLSIMFDLAEFDDGLLPTEIEQAWFDANEAQFSKFILGKKKRKPNALRVGYLAWNETIEYIWRVYKPDPVHDNLQKIIKKGDYPRGFDYRMDLDKEWGLLEWHLNIDKEKHDSA